MEGASDLLHSKKDWGSSIGEPTFMTALGRSLRITGEKKKILREMNWAEEQTSASCM